MLTINEMPVYEDLVNDILDGDRTSGLGTETVSGFVEQKI